MGRVNRKKYAKIRLYHGEGSLEPGKEVVLVDKNAHYVRDVMRAKNRDVIVLFDGVHGDWSCTILGMSRSQVVVSVECLIRAYAPRDSLTLCISLVKHDSMRNVVRQATEMGVTLIQPVVTEYSAVSSINVQKCALWAIEAAEQSGRCDVPDIAPTVDFDGLSHMSKTFVLCDETGQGQMPCEVLHGKTDVAVIVGPEGGFSKSELEYSNRFCAKMSLGSTILRVDTAVVAALSYVNEYYALNKVRDSGRV